MEFSDLGIEGRWLVANCGKIPSEKSCRVVIMAPEEQREDLLDAAVAHAIKTHGHQDTPELRSELDQLLESAEV